MRRAGTRDAEAQRYFDANGAGKRTFSEPEILTLAAMGVLLALSAGDRAEHRAATVAHSLCGTAKWRTYEAKHLSEAQKEFVREGFALGTQGPGKKGEKLSAPAAAQLMKEVGLRGPAHQYPGNAYFQERNEPVFGRLEYIIEADLKRHFSNIKGMAAGGSKTKKKKRAAKADAQDGSAKTAKTVEGDRGPAVRTRGASAAAAAIDTDALIGQVVVVGATVYRIDHLDTTDNEFFVLVNEENADDLISLTVESVWTRVEKAAQEPSPYDGNGGLSVAGQEAADRADRDRAASGAVATSGAAAAPMEDDGDGDYYPSDDD